LVKSYEAIFYSYFYDTNVHTPPDIAKVFTTLLTVNVGVIVGSTADTPVTASPDVDVVIKNVPTVVDKAALIGTDVAVLAIVVHKILAVVPVVYSATGAI
jgi:hypothetical protein